MKRKGFAWSLGILLLLSCCLFGACDSQKSGGKKGDDTVVAYAVSEQSYKTEKAAFQAFVVQEIASGTHEESDVETNVTADYGKYESKGEIPLDKVTLAAEYKEDLETIEKFSVTAKVKMTAENITSDALIQSGNLTQSAYLLRYKDKTVRYMVAAPETGERLTNSYLSAVTDLEKYTNYAFTYQDDSFEEGERYFYGQVVLADDAAVYETTYEDKARFEKRKPQFNEDDSDREEYTFLQNGKTVCAVKRYQKNGAEWEGEESKQTITECAQEKAEDVLWPLIVFPSVFWSKTKDGFTFVYTVEDSGQLQDLTFFATVRDDKVVSYTHDVRYGREDAKNDEAHIKVAFTDFGKTTVKVPQDVQNIKIK